MKDPVKIACFAVLTGFLATGCGGGGQETAEKKTAPAPVQQTKQDATPAANPTVTLKGKINLTGEAPKRSPLKMGADAVCAKAHSDAPAFSQDAVVDAQGMIQHVFVYVKNGLEGHEFEVPTKPVVFDQKGCMYTPHVFGIMVEQPLKILNSDPTLHNIHSLPENSKEFNLGMPRQGMEFTKSFDAEEVMVRIKCDVHPWMSAYAGVLSHPYYAVTDANGNYEIPNLPAGQYTIEAWHEKFGSKTESVTLGDTPVKDLHFTYQATGS